MLTLPGAVLQRNGFVVTDMILGRRYSVVISAAVGVLIIFLGFARPLGRKLDDDS